MKDLLYELAPCERAARLLLAHPAVVDCVVLSFRHGSQKRRVAYVVPSVSAAAGSAALERILADELISKGDRPDYILTISSLPLTAAGAVDRAALAALPLAASETARQWEERLTALPQTRGVAVRVEPVTTNTAVLSMSEILPDWQTSRRATTIESSVAAERPALAHGGALLPRPGDPRVLADILQRAASTDAGVVCVTATGDEVSYSYEELWAASLSVAAGLLERGLQPGDCVILQIRREPDFLHAFWGCALAGVVPLPLAIAPTYTEPGAVLTKLESAWQMLGRPLVLTDDELATDVRSLSRLLDLAGLRVETVSALRTAPPLAAPHSAVATDVALMLLTSGSTGRPKVVPLRHGNLLAMCAGFIQLNGFDADEVTLNWMPQDHVGSVVMLGAMSVDLCCTQIHVSSSYILADIVRWLDLIEKYRATISWAPNFAFGLLRERADAIGARTLDLSSMRFLVNGGESNVAKTIRACLRILAPHGLASDAIVPAFGMSETSSAITCSGSFSLQTTVDDMMFVELGPPIPGVNLRIVGKQSAGPLMEGVVGRLQVSGAAVFSGYHDAPEQNREAFTDGWFTTGDLGFLRDGRLVLTSRQKEDIVIYGINYYCHEIESVVEEVEGVVPTFAAACAVTEPGAVEESLAVFLHTDRSDDLSRLAILKQVRRQVARCVGIAPHFVIALEIDEIPKTGIGKIQRAALRKRFEAGELATALSLSVGEDDPRTVPDWFYRQVWRPRRLEGQVEPVSLVLICEDTAGLASALGSELEARGFDVVRSAPDADHGKVLSDLAAAGKPPQEILCLQPYAAIPGAPADATELESRQRRAVGPLLAIMQAWERLPSRSASANLRVVTSHGASLAADEPVAWENCMMPGLLATAAHEVEGLRTQVLDVQPGDPGAVAVCLADELTVPANEPQVCHRNAQRLVSRLVKIGWPDEPSAMPVEAGGFYIITGGLGRIGCLVARALLERYDARLLLTGRTQLPANGAPAADELSEERRRSLQALADAGGEVCYMAADAGDLAALRRRVSELEAEWERPLAGAFHLAATADERLLTAETAESLIAHARSRTAGAWALHRLLVDRPGALLVQFSSVNGLLGAFGYGAYAAGCSLVDRVSEAHTHEGRLRSFCFAWSMWDDLGVSEGLSTEAARAQGFRTISQERGLFSFQAGLEYGVQQMLVGLDGSNPAIRPWVCGPAAPLEQVAAYVEAEAGTPLPQVKVADPLGRSSTCAVVRVEALPVTNNGEVDIARLGEDRPLVAPRTATERALVEIWQELFQVPSIGVEDSFFDFGGESLLATMLAGRIRDQFGVELTTGAVFAKPTIAQLSELIEEEAGGAGGALPSLTPAEPAAQHPLSLTQQGLWFLDRLDGKSATYNEVLTMRLRGSLDAAHLGRAMRAVIARHDILRTCFPLAVNGPVQEVTDAAAGVFETVDLRDHPDCGAEVARQVSEMASCAFDLARGPLLRVLLLREEDELATLVLVLHHIITDDRSVRLFLDEWAECYERLNAGDETASSRPKLQYHDFAHWQRDWLQGEVLQAQLNYWRERLDGVPPLLQLPLDRPRPVRPLHHGGQVVVTLGPELVQQARALSRNSGTTLFMVLMSAFAATLSRFSGQDDVPIGMPVSSRRTAASERMLGFFINTLALRVELAGAPTFRALLDRIKEAATTAYAHQDLPFDQLVVALQPERDPSYHPLVQVMMQLKDELLPVLKLPGVRAEAVPQVESVIRLDLELHLHQYAGSVEGCLLYATDIFTPETATRFVEAFTRIMREGCARPATPVAELLAGAEHPTTSSSPPAPTLCMQELFERQVAATPDAVALVGDSIVMTYAELDRQANQMAHMLRGLGVGPEVPVGQFLHRSPTLVVGMLGILKAGGVYLPLDPRDPLARIAAVVAENRMPVLLSVEALLDTLPASLALSHMVALDIECDLLTSQPTHAPPRLGSADNAAYIIYTSGSTGRPKGVVATHGGFVNMIGDQIIGFDIQPEDRVGMFACASFDASLSEIFMALASGAALVPLTDEVRLDPAELLRVLVAEGVTVMTLPPSYLRMFGQTPLANLRVLITAGEEADVEDTRYHARRLAVYNAYGPTEGSVCASFHPVAPDEDYPSGVPIGAPLTGTEIHLLAADGRPVPVGSPGEICLGGAGLARGYLGCPNETAMRFVPHPGDPGKRLYRTGDIGRWREDGTVLYCGRTDFEVKVRGHRVNPGEVERGMLLHSSIADACVTARRDESGLTNLVGYYVLGKRLELWPSVAEFYIYDDILYGAMAGHEARNQRYLETFRRLLPGRTVVEIGPGPEVVLGRLALEAGAEKVYAIELLKETYERASAKLRQLGLEDRIVLLHGDAREIELPEQVDYCISEIVGTIGGSEGANAILQAARRFLCDPSCMIPARTETRFAAISLQDSADLAFPPIATHYIDRIFEDKGYRFDLRLCLKNAGRQHLISTEGIFEDLDHSQLTPLEDTHEIELNFLHTGRCHGFLAWLVLHVGDGSRLDTLDDQESWLPIYLPVSVDGISVTAGDVFRGRVERTLCENGLNPDYRIVGEIEHAGGNRTLVDVLSNHDRPCYRATPFYNRLFTGDHPPELRTLAEAGVREFLSERLPGYMVPSRLVSLSELPLLANGKVNRAALPAPSEVSRTTTAYLAPRGEIESAIAAVWEDVLGVDRVGAQDNFFQLGGHSLRLVQVAHALQDRYGLTSSAAEIFQYPTVEAFAEQIARRINAEAVGVSVAPDQQAQAGMRAAMRSELRALRSKVISMQQKN